MVGCRLVRPKSQRVRASARAAVRWSTRGMTRSAMCRDCAGARAQGLDLFTVGFAGEALRLVKAEAEGFTRWVREAEGRDVDPDEVLAPFDGRVLRERPVGRRLATEARLTVV